MKYISEMSELRYRKLVFYCRRCRAFRITYEPEARRGSSRCFSMESILKIYSLPT